MDLNDSLDSFFATHVDRALRHEGVSAAPMTQHYLVRLLSGFAAQPINDEPLALRMLQACDLAPRQRRSQLRDIGDTSLYVSGFWSESLQRSVVDVDYYIGMGESAYGELARSVLPVSADPFGGVFAELSDKFGRFARVLTAISETVTASAGPQDIVRLYDKWKRTGSVWARNRLARLGVTLCEEENKKLQ